MAEQSTGEQTPEPATQRRNASDAANPQTGGEENELEAEQESAAAMDADVPHTPDAADPGEGDAS